MNESPESIAKSIAKIYEEAFGGKDRGRYKISRRNLRLLSGRKRLEDTTTAKIMDTLYNLGFIMVDLGDDFAVVEEGVMLNYRPVPKAVLFKYLKVPHRPPSIGPTRHRRLGRRGPTEHRRLGSRSNSQES
jgi:hypothetical protein